MAGRSWKTRAEHLILGEIQPSRIDARLLAMAPQADRGLWAGLGDFLADDLRDSRPQAGTVLQQQRHATALLQDRLAPSGTRFVGRGGFQLDQVNQNPGDAVVQVAPLTL